MKVFKDDKTREEIKEAAEIIEKNEGRYSLYNFLIGQLALVDKEKRQIIFLKSNVWGQIYTIHKDGTLEKDDEVFKVDGRVVSGLIKRLGSFSYYKTSKVVDPYIYDHIMTDEDKDRCRRGPSSASNSFICSGDNLRDILVAAYEFSMEYHDSKDSLGQEKIEFWIKSYMDRIEIFVEMYE